MAVYSAATLFLTGMQDYHQVSPVSAFPNAFRSVGANFVAECVSLGEIVTLPVVTQVAIMAQPRLQYALAIDGLLPPIFSEVDAGGNLWKGTFIAGIIMTVVSAFVPFQNLNDMISCAVLMILALTDTSVVLLWHEGTPSQPELPGKLMFLFHCLSLLAGICITHFSESYIGVMISTLFMCALASTCYSIYRWCPRVATFGGHQPHYHEEQLRKEDGYFATPFVPLLPCAAVFINWYLISQLDSLGIGLLMCFMALSITYYFLYGAYHSVGNRNGWEDARGHHIELEQKVTTSDASNSQDASLGTM